MVRECRPPARKPTRSWLARRSTTATSTFANANSAASIIPVGPPPAITTACSVIATLRSDPSRRTSAFRSSIYVGSGLRRAIMRQKSSPHEGLRSGMNWSWRERVTVFHRRPLRTDDLLATQQRAAKRDYRWAEEIADGLEDTNRAQASWTRPPPTHPPARRRISAQRRAPSDAAGDTGRALPLIATSTCSPPGLAQGIRHACRERNLAAGRLAFKAARPC